MSEELTTLEKIREYRSDPGVNQSRLKSILSGTTGDELQDGELLLGSVVDCLLLTPQHFPDLYYVGGIPGNMTDKLPRLIRSVYQASPDLSDLFSEEGQALLLLKRKELQYQTRWSDASLITNLKKTSSAELYKFFQESEGRVVVGAEMVMQARAIVNDLRYYAADHLKTCRKQVILYGEYEKHRTKGMLDLVQEVNSTVTEIDLKVTHFLLRDFHLACRKYRYDLQRAFYDRLIRQNMSDKNVASPRMLVYSTRNKRAEWFVPNAYMMHIGEWGGTRVKSTVHIGSLTDESFYELERIYGYRDAFNMMDSIEDTGVSQDFNCWS